MINPGKTSPIDEDIFGKKVARRGDRFYINLEQDETKNALGQLIPTLRIRLYIPLNEIDFKKYPDEKIAKERFALHDQVLSVAYKVDGMILTDEMTNLNRAFDEIYKPPLGEKLKQGDTRISRPDLNSLLVPLVEQGRDIFYRLFIVDIKPINYHGEGAEIVRNAIKSAFSHYQIICITSPVSLFPWAFLFYDPLYDPDNLSTLKPKSFWGFKHEIQETLAGTSQEIIVPANPKLVAAICSDVDGNWHNGPDHPFTKWANRKLLKLTPSTTELGNALENFDEDCLYFFGHADHPDPPIPSKSYLELRSQQLTVTTLQQKYKKAPSFNKDLVVALFNGCKTAPLNHWDTRTMVGFLCLNNDHNRLCCVSTVGKVPAAFAGKFAKHFWGRFLLRRDPIGRALLMARRRMLARLRNPLGLLYSLFGRADAQVEDSQEANNG